MAVGLWFGLVWRVGGYPHPYHIILVLGYLISGSLGSGFSFSFFSSLSGHLLSYFHLYLSIDQDHFCLNLERGSRALRGTGRTGIRAQAGHRGLGAWVWSPGRRRRPVWVSWLCGLVSGWCVCRDMTPLASCRTGESGGAYGALYEEGFGSDSALSLSSALCACEIPQFA